MLVKDLLFLHAIEREKLPRRKFKNPSVNHYAGRVEIKTMSKSQKMKDRYNRLISYILYT